MKAYSVDLVVGLAEHLAAAGLARYSPTGIYTGEGLPAVFFGTLPDKPDTAVLINTYNDDRERDDDSPDLYVQMRFRTAGRNPHTTPRLADDVFEHLHDRSNFTLPNGVQVLLCRRHITGPNAPDANGRYTRPDSYTLTLNPS
ncbi:minor capsid protein [Rhodococcus sp. UNC363MFTsu5.1]|uniref:minor capsid protein n=1 Tax=Rhodococcus sp. UNC363MFTsu5.1 TaxID=1449069 RepID=UPI00047F3566|nr:minor capsid protein [Rhodococcus sp. UNC363MFTsu5.1]